MNDACTYQGSVCGRTRSSLQVSGSGGNLPAPGTLYSGTKRCPSGWSVDFSRTRHRTNTPSIRRVCPDPCTELNAFNKDDMKHVVKDSCNF